MGARRVIGVSLPPFRVTVVDIGCRVALVSVSGELDLYVESELREALKAADSLRSSTIVVDLSGISFMDSTACGVLLHEAKRRVDDESELVLVTNGNGASRVLEVAGIDRVLKVYPTLHAALNASLVEVPA